jgi:hypothetical protein
MAVERKVRRERGGMGPHGIGSEYGEIVAYLRELSKEIVFVMVFAADTLSFAQSRKFKAVKL